MTAHGARGEAQQLYQRRSSGATTKIAKTASIPDTNPFSSAADLQEGSALYQTHCSYCHGSFGEGGRGADLTAGVYKHGGRDPELYANGGEMAPLVTALQAKEARHQELTQLLQQASGRPDARRLNRALMEAELYKRLMSWRKLLDENATQARLLLKKLLGKE